MLPELLDPRPYFANQPDPRRETWNKLHKLHDILMIVLCAVLSGVEDWVGMEAFAEEKEAGLRGFLELPPDTRLTRVGFSGNGKRDMRLR